MAKTLKDANKLLASEKKTKFKLLDKTKIPNELIYEANVNYTVKYGSLTKYRKQIGLEIKTKLESFPYAQLKGEFDKIKETKGIDFSTLISKAHESLSLLFNDDTMLTKSINCGDENFLFYRSDVNLGAIEIPKSYSSRPEARGLFLIDATAAMYLQKKALSRAIKAAGLEKESMKDIYTIGQKIVDNTQTKRTIKQDVRISTSSLFTQTASKGSGSSTKEKSILGQTIIYVFNCDNIDTFFPINFRIGIAPILKGKYFPESVIKGPTFFFVDLYGMEESKFVGGWSFSKGQMSLSVNKKMPDIVVYGLRVKMIAYSSNEVTDAFKDAEKMNRKYNIIKEERDRKRNIEIRIENKKNPSILSKKMEETEKMEEEAKPIVQQQTESQPVSDDKKPKGPNDQKPTQSVTMNKKHRLALLAEVEKAYKNKELHPKVYKRLQLLLKRESGSYSPLEIEEMKGYGITFS